MFEIVVAFLDDFFPIIPIYFSLILSFNIVSDSLFGH